MMALSGVRSSWLMLETNCDLCSLANWSWRLLSSISRNRRAFWIASLQEMNGTLGKFAWLLAPDHERPDDALCADQRHDEARPKSGPHCDLSDRAWRLVADICDLQWLSIVDRPAERIGSAGWLASDCRNQLIAQAIRRPHPQRLVQLIKNIDHPSIRIRKLDRLGHDRGQHGLQIEGGVDRLGDLAERLQLLDRLRQFGRALFDLTLELLGSLRLLRQQLVAFQGVPAKDLDRPSHRRDLVAALCCHGRVQASTCDRKHAIAQRGQAAHDAAADIQPHDERRAYDAQHYGCDDGERAEFHHPQRLSVCVVDLCPCARDQVIDGRSKPF